MVEPFINIYIPNKSIFGGELRFEKRLILHVSKILDETNSYKDNEIKYEEFNIKSEILDCSLFLNIGIV